MVTVRQGKPCVCGGAERRTDARDDFEGNAGLAERFGFFRSAAEKKRIATFEAHNALACAGERDELDFDGILFGLFGRPIGATFTDETDIGIGFGQVEQCGVDEFVMENHIGGGEKFCAALGDEAGVSGATTNEVDDAIGGRWDHGGVHVRTSVT
jgi:hypothetical protein